MVPVPADELARVAPHPYERLGAPYGEYSPYWLRASVLDALLGAQVLLQQRRSGWRLQLFDAYRPRPVQQFMVDHTAQALAQARGQIFHELPASERRAVLSTVYQFWALPSSDPKTPPPHSTGAAVDLTLLDERGMPVDMGSPIDEVSARSHPDYFQTLADAASQKVHHNRSQLREILQAAGFQQHPNEWWHYSRGDQLWAWRCQAETGTDCIAYYGCAELLAG